MESQDKHYDRKATQQQAQEIKPEELTRTSGGNGVWNPEHSRTDADPTIQPGENASSGTEASQPKFGY